VGPLYWEHCVTKTLCSAEQENINPNATQHFEDKRFNEPLPNIMFSATTMIRQWSK